MVEGTEEQMKAHTRCEDVTLSNSFFKKRESCPACRSKDHSTLYSCSYIDPTLRTYLESFYNPQGKIEFEYLKDASYVLEECSDCGLVFQNEIPNDFLMTKLYEEWIDPKMALKGAETARLDDHYSGYAREIMMLIAYFETVPRQMRFLDFGMGWGDWCMMAKGFGCDCYGTELSGTRIEYAKSHGVHVLNWEEIIDSRFDVINLEQVLEHIPEPLKTLCYLRRALKAQGLIKVSVPDGGDIKKRLKICDWTAPKGSKNSLNVVSPLEHINCFSRRAITRMVDMAGFEMVEIPFSIQVAYSTNWRLLKPALKNFLRPLYRSVFHRGTYVFLRQRRE